ncbi:MAG: hypothetical protein U9Q08_00645 [Candidatus Omnitrophota bacterium]|nr:hypothetical protein [Candidatus Omnitrophota bacterium]
MNKTAFQIALIGVALLLAGFIGKPLLAQEDPTPAASAAGRDVEIETEAGQKMIPGHITIDFKDADIRNVLRAISYKSGINIVAGPEVKGTVTVRLINVLWDKALDVILTTHDLGYEQDGSIITVSTLEKLAAQKKAAQELAKVEAIITKVFRLKYLDAGDAKKVLENQVSSRGTITVLEEKGQKGWTFGADEFAKREREEDERMVRSQILVVSDIPSYLKRIEEIIVKIDVRPRQILIETKIVEVKHDYLKDLGLEFGSGQDGWSPILGETGGQLTAKSNPLSVTPSGFNPGSADITGMWDAATGFTGGFTLMYQKILGTDYRAILHALEEDVDADILSAPRIMTLNNQEATIMVGEKFPILKGEVEEGVLTTSLDYYQDIGIQLNVVPQVSENNQINMIVHPSVTSYTATVSGKSQGEDISQYPIIITREAETQLLINDGDTIVIGGLLKDVTASSVIGVPFLSKIPLLGLFFQRRTTDIEKIDLLIFITAHIVKPGGYIVNE